MPKKIKNYVCEYNHKTSELKIYIIDLKDEKNLVATIVNSNNTEPNKIALEILDALEYKVV